MRAPGFALLAVALAAGAAAQPVVIDFDGTSEPCIFGATTALTTRYAGQGVVFSGPGGGDGGAILDECGNFGVSGHSSPNFLAFNLQSSLQGGAIPRGPETITFTPATDSVSCIVGSDWGGSATMECFTAGGSSLGTDTTILDIFMSPLSVVAAGIDHCVVSFSGGDALVLDDLTFGGPAGTSCTVSAPAGVHSGPVTIPVITQSGQAATAAITLEWSGDGGVTWSLCTMAPGSPTPNPSGYLPLGSHDLLWDSRGDGAGLAGAATVDLRATVDDGTVVTTCSGTVDVDNFASCTGVCGDCDGDLSGPDILDALVGAQIGAQIVTPTPAQRGCCDVNSDGAVNVLDALRMAQNAASLPVGLTCP